MSTTNDERRAEFFPGARRQLLLERAVPLADREGFRRWNLTFVVPLADGKVVGIPDWLQRPIKLVQQANNGGKSYTSIVEIDGMKINCFEHDQAENPERVFDARIKKITVRRTSTEAPSGQLAEVEVAFNAYVQWEGTASYIDKWFDRKPFISFGSGQATITFGKPAREKKEESGTLVETGEGNGQDDKDEE